MKISKTQEKLAPDIQLIAQEELQYVMDNLKEFEGLSEKQINGMVITRVRERCISELNMDIGF